MNTPPEELTVAQVAAKLGRSEDSIRAFANRRKIGTLREGWRMFTPADVEFIRQNLRSRPGCPLMDDHKTAAELSALAVKKRTTKRKRADRE